LIPYIGDFHDGSTVRYMFNTTGSNGASIAPTTLGTVKCYKDNTAGSVNTSGITTAQFNSLTGVYSVSIDTTNAFYTEAADYIVILEGSTIDGQSVTTPLFQFSIANRYDAIADAVWLANRTQYGSGNTMGHTLEQLRKANYITEGTVTSIVAATNYIFSTTLTNETNSFNNQTLLFISGDHAGTSIPILTYTVTDGLVELEDPLHQPPNTNDQFVILPDHVHSRPEIADGILNRLLDSSDSSVDVFNERTVRSALRAMRNKVSVNSGAIVVYKENDTDAAWEGTVSNTSNVTVNPDGGD
jgi:hypothetical protein